jgi:hypothetical protein
MLVDKQTAQAVTAEIQAAMQEILAKHGMEQGKVSIKYGEIFKVTFEATPVALNENGVNVNTPEAQSWLYLGEYRGFANPASVLGTTFTMNGKTFKFVGFNERAPRMPVVAVDVKDGKQYKIDAKALRFIAGYNASDDRTVSA